MFINLNPLEQFSVYSATSAILGSSSNSLAITSLTNIAILFIIGLLVLTIFQISASSHLIKPTRWNIVLETWVASILGIVKDQIGNDAKNSLIYFPLIFTFFSFVFISNILGMIPYSFTPTSHISVTLGLSIAIMIGVTLIGFSKHQLDFFSLFVPKGTPLALVPLLVLIEFISYSARAFSLALRLTANVSAGHCLFGVISALSVSACIAVSSLLLKGITITLPLAVLVVLYGLELLVALLQSYVFTLLTCSYLADVVNMGDH
uniref:ATP synthase subunit a n=1 Tax=Allomyces macrogynus TaxID=28583 RepID=ATP6_ALLMA|nr:H(+)-transporting ATPase, F0 subunit 6 [Allomyces macrogynus]P50364.1 RecName: Full=ATP synthase subunit a; AltName: Full=F-ATPase protein 6 [Allomyces macrogynus]AAA64932.1 subunit 6 of the ATPase complex [Allomyces macrogynus]AAC49231.1 H(+)-transporting ATPase, F0 subunit 6 [Allomyces macrogynus]